MKKIALKINFKKVDFKRILSKIIHFRRLLFIMFFGVLLIFTFNIICQYAFLNIEYINYVEDDSFIVTNGKINNINLNRVLKNINKDRKEIEAGIKKEYKNPFSFKNSELSEESDYEINVSKGKNQNEDKNIDSEYLNNNITTSFEL